MSKIEIIEPNLNSKPRPTNTRDVVFAVQQGTEQGMRGMPLQDVTDEIKRTIDITGIELKPVQGGATSANATALPSVNPGQKAKAQASPGWYMISGTAVEAEEGYDWVVFNDGNAWSLERLGKLPKVPLDVIGGSLGYDNYVQMAYSLNVNITDTGFVNQGSVNGDGTFNTNSNSRRTDFIKLAKGAELTYRVYVNTSNPIGSIVYNAAYYDINKNYIGMLSSKTMTDASSLQEFKHTATADMYVVIWSYTQGVPSNYTASIVKNDSLLTSNRAALSNPREEGRISVAVGSSFTLNSVSTSTGAIQTSGTFARSGYIPVKAGQTVKARSRASTAGSPAMINLYSAQNQASFVSTLARFTRLDESLEYMEVVIPSDGFVMVNTVQRFSLDEVFVSVHEVFYKRNLLNRNALENLNAPTDVNRTPVSQTLNLTVNSALTFQTFKGGYVEIQPDSLYSGVNTDVDSTTNTWGFPSSLLPQEQTRLRDLFFNGNKGIQYIRFPLGFAFRGYRNINSQSGLAMNIGERFVGQNESLKRLFKLMSESGGGLAPEYWCPPPHWLTSGSYWGDNQLSAGQGYPRTTTLHSIKASNPTQYWNQIELFTDAVVNDYEYIHENIAPVRMYSLQNEPSVNTKNYGACIWTDQVYSDTMSVLHPKVKASEILSFYNGEPNNVLLHVNSNIRNFEIGQTYIDNHAEDIWAYSTHNIEFIGDNADYIKDPLFQSTIAGKTNTFINECEYFIPTATSDEWKCANNMLRDVHGLELMGSEVIMPIIHVCKPIGQTASQNNTSGYALTRCNLQEQYGKSPADLSTNPDQLAYGTFMPNDHNYNSYSMWGDNLPVGAIRVSGGINLASVEGVSASLWKFQGKLILLLANRNPRSLSVNITFENVVNLSGKLYNVNNNGSRLMNKSGKNISIIVSPYSGNVWKQIDFNF